MAPAVERTSAVISHHSVVVIGAGQAGLSVAYALQQRGIRPLVLEKIALDTPGISSDGIPSVL